VQVKYNLTCWDPNHACILGAPVYMVAKIPGDHNTNSPALGLSSFTSEFISVLTICNSTGNSYIYVCGIGALSTDIRMFMNLLFIS
jgi:hypothetical protein